MLKQWLKRLLVVDIYLAVSPLGKYPLLLCSWSLVETNTRSYWLIYGHVAMAKSKCRRAGDNLAIVARSPTNQRLL